ncbi:MAG: L,D-transpeptidase [Chloroflexota bacterium]
MHRGTILKVGVVVLILLATAGTAFGKTWSASQAAKDSFQRQASSLHGQLASDANKGMTAKQLAPFRARLNTVDRAKAPSSLNYWTQGASFYAKQSRRVRGIRSDLSAGYRDSVRIARRSANASLASLAAVIARARSYQTGSSAASSALAAQRERVKVATTPRALGTSLHATNAAKTQLDRSLAPEQSFLKATLADQNSESIAAQASQLASNAQPQLGLLSLFASKQAGSYRAAINGRLGAVRAAKSNLAAAVGEWRLRSTLAAEAELYKQKVPAKFVLVNTANQSVNVYQNGKSILTAPATTGGPELPTLHGIFHIFEKITPFVFHSPFPITSPYYYLPSPVTYWMPFDEGQGLHDAPWRSNFGADSNLQPTNLGDGNTILGTHGCVNLPFSAAQFIWNWSTVGTTVVVI